MATPTGTTAAHTPAGHPAHGEQTPFFSHTRVTPQWDFFLSPRREAVT